MNKKSNNYRYELEKLKPFNNFIVEGKVECISSKFTDSFSGGYRTKTMLLTNVGIALRSKKDKKLHIVMRIDHIWIAEDTNTIPRDKNTEIGDIVKFRGKVYEYKYSHGAIQLGIKQSMKGHVNITKGISYKILYK